MRSLRAVLIAGGVLALVCYVGAVLFVATQQTRLVFLPHARLGDLRPAPPFEQVELGGPPSRLQAGPIADTAGRPFAWVMRSAAADAAVRPWVLFFHGNDATVAAQLNVRHYERLRRLDLNVLAPEYPGFAGIAGIPSESSIDREADAAYTFLRDALGVPPNRIVIYGWSLGSAVAVDLASHVNEGAVILEGAPASVAAIAEMRYPWMPVRLLLKNPFQSILKVGSIHAPVLFLHSPDDQVIPIGEGRRLFDAARPPKQFVEVSGGHIYASETDPHFFNAVDTFLAQYGVTTGS